MLEVTRGMAMRAAGAPTLAATNNSAAISQVVNRCLNLRRVSHKPPGVLLPLQHSERLEPGQPVIAARAGTAVMIKETNVRFAR
jgi:hypothetical protein